MFRWKGKCWYWPRMTRRFFMKYISSFISFSLCLTVFLIEYTVALWNNQTRHSKLLVIAKIIGFGVGSFSCEMLQKWLVIEDFDFQNLIFMCNEHDIRNQHAKIHRKHYILSRNIFFDKLNPYPTSAFYPWVIPWDLWHVYTNPHQIVWNFQGLCNKQF
jgi:hypothetical protein